MLSYIRTCLWNRQYIALTSFRGCDMFIPPSFRPIVDDAAVQAFRHALFGTQPDPAFLLYRTHLLLTLLHTSYYRRYVYDWDNRLTYDLNEPLLAKLFAVETQNTGGEIRLEGLPVVDEERGSCYVDYTVSTAVNGDTVSVRDARHLNPLLLPRNTVVPIPGTSMRLLIQPVLAASATIYAATRPGKNCADIVLDVNHSHAKNVAKHVFAASNDGALAELRAAYYGESDATEQFALLCFAVARYTALRSEVS